MDRDMAIIGYKGGHVQAGIVESAFTKKELEEWKKDCEQYGITRFERIPCKNARLLHE